MKKLSIKLGAIFFLCILGLESFMFFFLHSALVESRIQEELNALQARGNSHRAILENHFTPETIAHVTLMETESTTDVVVTDADLQILGSSSKNEQLIRNIKLPSNEIPQGGLIIENDWETEPFISTVSSLENEGEIIGYVFMFQDTETVHSLIKRLNQHFVFAGFLTVALTLFIIALLSKAITKPLIKMKDATFQISQGNYSISLPETGNDELGDLAKSIESLAHDLTFLTQERNDFLASISHELRTPITYIKGYTEIIMKRELSEIEKQNYLVIILEETNRLNDLIKQLFDLAKMDQNSFLIEKTEVNIKEILEKVEAKLAPAFKEKGMTLYISCQKDFFLQADPIRMEQIFFNLLDNSMKYSAAGGTTNVSVELKKSQLFVTIRDTGNGIPEEDLPHIFNRFYRVDKSRTRLLGGAGLGLSIVKELVNKHNGTIMVKSQIQEGTEFQMMFRGAWSDENDLTGGR
ncbi:integral membrane sensor signal transduction histidine kinase [Mycobacteroides abscessus subsp. abscessus]|nr:integral membrane sensor signal transduction histidine kinase [Mycobacteroides abscessus subsp. abscessus]